LILEILNNKFTGITSGGREVASSSLVIPTKYFVSNCKTGAYGACSCLLPV